MPTAAKLEAVRRLLGAAPDATLRTLGVALSSAYDLGDVRELIEREQRVRNLYSAIFAPLLPLCTPRQYAIAGVRLSAEALRQVFRALRARHADEIELAADALERWEPMFDPPPVEFDELCVAGARLIEQDAVAGVEGEEGRELAIFLRLSPMARQAVARLTDWIGKPNEERTAVLRLIFRDAVAVTEDAAPRLIEVMLASLAEPWQILRPISLLTERAGDRYLAASEMGAFGERLLEAVEVRLDALRTFDLRGGAPAARVAAQGVAEANAILSEFEQSIGLSRDGPWGKRIAAARTAMATLIESRLREAERAVELALPMQAVRITGRMTRPAPKVAAPPDPRLVEPARALLVLLGETRQAAATGGFGALRTQVAETLCDRLEVYADELIHLLNSGEAPDADIARTYLELAAEFLEVTENDKAAQIVRRRAAVAGSGAPSQDVA